MTNIKNWRIGTSTCLTGVIHEAHMRDYAEAGIQCVELSHGHNDLFDNQPFTENTERFAEMSEKYGVELWSIHLPFGRELDIAQNDASVMNTHTGLLESAGRIGMKVAVVHPSAEPVPDEDRERQLHTSKMNLQTLSQAAKAAGMRLAVENLPRTCLGNHSDDLLFLMDGNPDLYVVYDTNHLLKQDNIEFIRALGDRIITLHVSDYDFIDERHQLPMQGKNDWKGVIAALEEADYAGPWLYEVPARGVVTPRQLVENYHALTEL